jgi:hypothetical protein
MWTVLTYILNLPTLLWPEVTRDKCGCDTPKRSCTTVPNVLTPQHSNQTTTKQHQDAQWYHKWLWTCHKLHGFNWNFSRLCKMTQEPLGIGTISANRTSVGNLQVRSWGYLIYKKLTFWHILFPKSICTWIWRITTFTTNAGDLSLMVFFRVLAPCRLVNESMWHQKTE